MALVKVARLAARRWLVCALGLVATVAGCWFVSQQVATDFRATSQVMLILPPAATGTSNPTNPYLNLPEGLVTTAGLVTSDLNSLDSQRDLAAAGDTADYTIEVVPDAGPLIAVSATSQDPATALRTRDALMDRVDAELADRQAEAGTPPDQEMHGTRSSVSERAEPLTARRTKAVAATGVAGLVVTLLLALLVDRSVQRRRDRSRRPDDATAAGPGPEPESQRSWRRPVVVGTRPEESCETDEPDAPRARAKAG